MAITLEEFKVELTASGFVQSEDSTNAFEHWGGVRGGDFITTIHIPQENIRIELTSEGTSIVGAKLYRYVSTLDEREVLNPEKISFNFEKILLGTFTF